MAGGRDAARGCAPCKQEWHIESASALLSLLLVLVLVPVPGCINALLCLLLFDHPWESFLCHASAATLVVGNGGCSSSVYGTPIQRRTIPGLQTWDYGGQSAECDQWQSSEKTDVSENQCVLFTCAVYVLEAKMCQNVTNLLQYGMLPMLCILSRILRQISLYCCGCSNRCHLQMTNIEAGYVVLNSCFFSTLERMCHCVYQPASASADHQGWNGERPPGEEIYLFLVICSGSLKMCSF